MWIQYFDNNNDASKYLNKIPDDLFMKTHYPEYYLMYREYIKISNKPKKQNKRSSNPKKPKYTLISSS